MTKTVVCALALLLAALFSGCEDTEWSETAPLEIREVWVEVSDDVLAGFERQDTITVAATRVTSHRWFEDERRTRSGAIRRVSKAGSRYVVFWGEPNSNHIAANRYAFGLNPSGGMASIDEVLLTGVDHRDGYIALGRFTIGRR